MTAVLLRLGLSGAAARKRNIPGKLKLANPARPTRINSRRANGPGQRAMAGDAWGDDMGRDGYFFSAGTTRMRMGSDTTMSAMSFGAA